MTDLRAWTVVAVIALVTAAIRFLPFALFNGRNTPKILLRLGNVLPYAIMGMLVVYCLKGVHFADPSGFLPSLAGCLVVGALYVWKRNTLLSILCGTLCYMLFVQVIF